MTITELPSIPGLEQLDAVPAGAISTCEPFYAEDAKVLELCCHHLACKETHFVAPATGWPKNIYRRA